MTEVRTEFHPHFVRLISLNVGDFYCMNWACKKNYNGRSSAWGDSRHPARNTCKVAFTALFCHFVTVKANYHLCFNCRLLPLLCTHACTLWKECTICVWLYTVERETDRVYLKQLQGRKCNSISRAVRLTVSPRTQCNQQSPLLLSCTSFSPACASLYIV